MAETARCPSCDDILPADAPRGLCPQCLLRQFLGGDRCEPRDRGHDAGNSGTRGDPRDDGEMPIVPPVHIEIPRAGAPAEMEGMTIGLYRIVRELGTGGMGAVYEASQEQPVRRTVAVKIIRPGMDTERVIARFEAERQALAMMDHPNIARVLDAGSTPDSRPYFVMELVRGAPITRFCREQHLGYRERLELLATVCQAIQHAHQKGIIHRDIKPSNVLVTTYDRRAVPKVIDFGLAKAIGPALIENADFTGIGTILGTLPYMSPEQAGASLDVDTRTDVYALGVLLYELLTGTTPIAKERLQGAAPAEVLRIIREEEPPRPSLRLSQAKGSTSAPVASPSSRLKSALRQELDWMVMKALEKDRSRRYASAGELAEEIGRYLANEPVKARPPSRAYRLKKLARRHRAGVTIAGLSLIALTTLAVVSTLFSIELAASLRESNRRAAAFWFERGQAAFEREEVGQGLVAMVETWRSAAAARDPAWQHTARAALSAWHRGGPQVLSVFSHPGAIRDVGFSPDGRTAFTASLDRTVRLWDIATGRPIGEPLEHRLPPTVIVFTADSSGVVTGDEAGIARSWDAATGRPSGPAMLHIGPVRGLAIGPDGKIILTASDANRSFSKRKSRDSAVRFGFSPRDPDTLGEIQLWDAATGERAGLPIMLDSPVLSAAFSPDRTTILAGCVDHTARRCVAATGSPVGPPMPHEGAVVAVAFSPDGRSILTGSEDRMARLWDAAAGQLDGEPLVHQGAVVAVAFSPDGKTFFTGCADGTVQSWDAQTRKPRGTPSRQAQFKAMALTVDGKRVLTGGGATQLRIFPTAAGEPPRLIDQGEIAGSQRPVLALAFSPDGRTILIAGGSPDLRKEEYWRLNLTSGRIGTSTNLPRGFLRALDAATGRSVQWQELTDEPFRAIAYRSDGRSVLVASDWDARILDAETGRPLGAPLEHRGLVQAVAFSRDGRLALTAGTYPARLWQSVDLREQRMIDQGEIRCWDAATGTLRLRKPCYTVRAVAFGRRDHEGVAILLAMNRVVGVDLNTGKMTSPVYTRVSPGGKLEIHESPMQGTTKVSHASPVRPGPIGSVDRTVEFSRDGGSALVVEGHSVSFRDLTLEDPERSTSDPRSRVLDHLLKAGPIRVAAMSPGGGVVLTGGEDGIARLWSPKTWEPMRDPLVHPPAVNCAAFSPDGSIALTGGDDGTVRLWEVATGKRLGIPLIHKATVLAATFSPDGRHILTGCEDGHSYLWDPALAGRPEIALASATPGRILAAALSPDGQLLLTGAEDGDVRLWDARTGRPLGPPRPHPRRVHSVAFSPDGKTILAGTWMQARLYDAATGEARGGPLIHQQGFVSSVAFSPDGRIALTGGEDCRAWLWDTTTGQAISKLMGHNKPVSAVAYGPDGRTVAVALDTEVRIYHPPTTAPPGRRLKHPAVIKAVIYSPDGRTLLTLCADGIARLRDAASGEPRGKPLTRRGGIHAVAFSPDGKTIITGGDDRKLALWDPATGRLLAEPLETKGAIIAVGYSRDGQTMFTAAADRTAQFWDATTRRPLGRPFPLPEKLACLQIDVTGKTLLALGQDGTVRLWDVAELPDDFARVATWIEVQTGLTTDADGSITALDHDAWQQRQRRLDQLGGPPEPR
jgi:eukaryotic-like serine/threonine-protein kinase